MFRFSFNAAVMASMVAFSGHAVAGETGAAADSLVTPNNTRSGDTTNEPVPGVNQLLTPPALSSLTAAINAQPSGTSFRATIVPGELLRSSYEPIISDFQASLATDTSTASSGGAKTTLALATDIINPLSWQSGLANSARISCKNKFKSEFPSNENGVWDDGNIVKECKVACLKPVEAACKVDYTKCEPGLTYDSCVATIKTLGDICLSQKRETCAQDKGIAECTHPKNTAVNREVLACMWGKIASTWVPRIQIAVAGDIFPIAYYNDPAGKNSGPTEPFGGTSGQVALTFRPSERLSLGAWGTLKAVRPNGLPHALLADYYGASLQVAYMIVRFSKSDPKSLAASDDYVKSGFIPGLAGGLSAQAQHCVQADSNCGSLPPNQWSVTPFVDTRLSPTIQFRLAVQVSQAPIVDPGAIGITPLVTVASSF